MFKLPQKRHCLIIVLAFLALACVFAGVFVFTHLEHDCTGRDCVVCLQIQIAQNALNALGCCGVVVLLGVAASSRAGAKSRPWFRLPLLSPVSLHIQSNT